MWYRSRFRRKAALLCTFPLFSPDTSKLDSTVYPEQKTFYLTKIQMWLITLWDFMLIEVRVTIIVRVMMTLCFCFCLFFPGVIGDANAKLETHHDRKLFTSLKILLLFFGHKRKNRWHKDFPIAVISWLKGRFLSCQILKIIIYLPGGPRGPGMPVAPLGPFLPLKPCGPGAPIRCKTR